MRISYSLLMEEGSGLLIANGISAVGVKATTVGEESEGSASWIMYMVGGAGRSAPAPSQTDGG